MALEDVIKIFAAWDWPENTAAAALEYIAARLIESGDRKPAYEMLRRDHHARALLDLNRRAWTTVLRVVLGNQSPDYAFTSEGHGLLSRLCTGQQLSELLEDDELGRTFRAVAPRQVRRIPAQVGAVDVLLGQELPDA